MYLPEDIWEYIKVHLLRKMHVLFPQWITTEPSYNNNLRRAHVRIYFRGAKSWEPLALLVRKNGCIRSIDTELFSIVFKLNGCNRYFDTSMTEMENPFIEKYKNYNFKTNWRTYLIDGWNEMYQNHKDHAIAIRVIFEYISNKNFRRDLALVRVSRK
jgi:hypothetical protein